MDIEECIREGFLQKAKADKPIIEKELKSAEYDFGRAKTSLESGDHKWSTIQSYYAIFHASRALLFSVGYREKRHFAIGTVLEKMSQENKINAKLVSDFHAAMSAREDADYRDVYSKETSEYLLGLAEEFLSSAKKILKRHFI